MFNLTIQRYLRKIRSAGKRRYLIQPWLAIGDMIFAIEIVESIWTYRPDATIDLFCTDVQSQVAADHPRRRQITLPTSSVSLRSSDWPEMRIFPIPNDFYSQSEGMKQRRQEYKALLPEYETVFIEDTKNFQLLFGRSQHFTHNSLRLLEIQALIEKFLPLPIPFLPEMPKYRRTRALVDAYFGSPSPARQENDAAVPLFLASHRIAEAEQRAAHLKKQAERPDGLLFLVNADTSSPVTRPPTHLLISGIARALQHHPHIVVGILPGYTCSQAPEQVYRGLETIYGRQIQYVEPSVKPEHLLDTIAFIDQADMFITGDTGLMHLAATHKMTSEIGQDKRSPRNDTSIITVWGGTRPGYWGYPKLTTILGEGNSLQRHMYPGIRKYQWLQREADYFGHLHPGAITNAIIEVQKKRC